MKTQTQNGNGIYKYDYLNGMKVPKINNENNYHSEFNQDYIDFLMKQEPKDLTRKEKTFLDVMERQSKYPFLNHGKRTPEEEKKVIQNVWERVKKLQTTIIMLMFVLGITLTGCEKDFNKYNPDPPIEKMITQSFSLEIPIEKYDMTTKGFDPSIWVHPLSSEQFELKISNELNTYTRMVSVNEMLSGTINITMVSGTYDITYIPIQDPRFDNVLDISINMSDVVINGTSTIILQGQLDDALIIFDLPITNIWFNYPNLAGFTKDPQGFWWAYSDRPIINDGMINEELILMLSSGSEQRFSLPDLQKGVVYWIQNSIGATIQLTIPNMTIQTMVI